MTRPAPICISGTRTPILSISSPQAPAGISRVIQYSSKAFASNDGSLFLYRSTDPIIDGGFYTSAWYYRLGINGTPTRIGSVRDYPDASIVNFSNGPRVVLQDGNQNPALYDTTTGQATPVNLPAVPAGVPNYVNQGQHGVFSANGRYYLASLHSQAQACCLENDSVVLFDLHDQTSTLVLPDTTSLPWASQTFPYFVNDTGTRLLLTSSQNITSTGGGTGIDDRGVRTYVVTKNTPPDTTPPVVTGTLNAVPNDHGWLNRPVTITWTATDPDDPTSALTLPAPTTLTTEGANQVVTSGQACDPAGNCATGSITVNLDQTPPTVTVVGPTNGATYDLGQQPPASCLTVDALSGVRSPAIVSVIQGAGGHYTVNCTGAADNADNAAAASLQYLVAPNAASLQTLTDGYLATSSSPNTNGARHSLDAKLAANKICSYIDEVNSQTSGPQPTLTPAQATDLIYWARILAPSC